jgi:hypothetical protein
VCSLSLSLSLALSLSLMAWCRPAEGHHHLAWPAVTSQSSPLAYAATHRLRVRECHVFAIVWKASTNERENKRTHTCTHTNIRACAHTQRERAEREQREQRAESRERVEQTKCEKKMQKKRWNAVRWGAEKYTFVSSCNGHSNGAFVVIPGWPLRRSPPSA